MVCTSTAVASVYAIKQFLGNEATTTQKIAQLKSTIENQTSQLEITTKAVQIARSKAALYTVAWTSNQGSQYTPFTKPPYGNVAQVYWSTAYGAGTLVSTNGTSTYVWVGNVWLPVANGVIVGTTVQIASILQAPPRVLPTNSMFPINANGSSTSAVAFSGTLLGVSGVLTQFQWSDDLNTFVAQSTPLLVTYHLKWQSSASGGSWVTQ
ncbi:MAG TPA: hypothetical protein VGM95_00135 [Lactobacillaceae bacterium]